MSSWAHNTPYLLNNRTPCTHSITQHLPFCSLWDFFTILRTSYKGAYPAVIIWVWERQQRFSYTVKHVTTSFILRVNTLQSFIKRRGAWGQEKEEGMIKREREGRPAVRKPYTAAGRPVTMTYFQKRCKGTGTDALKEMFRSKGSKEWQDLLIDLTTE